MECFYLIFFIEISPLFYLYIVFMNYKFFQIRSTINFLDISSPEEIIANMTENDSDKLKIRFEKSNDI